MTERFDLLLQSIQQANLFTVRIFLFSLCALVAYPVISWMPEIVRRPTQYLYLASMLALFVLTTVYFGGL